MYHDASICFHLPIRVRIRSSFCRYVWRFIQRVVSCVCVFPWWILLELISFFAFSFIPRTLRAILLLCFLTYLVSSLTSVIFFCVFFVLLLFFFLLYRKIWCNMVKCQCRLNSCPRYNLSDRTVKSTEIKLWNPTFWSTEFKVW